MELNTELVGKKYPPAGYEVTAEAIQKYAAATNEDNPAFSGPDPVAPPCFPMVPAGLTVAQALFDPELGANLLRLVHGEQDHLFHEPIKSGDTLSVESSLESVEKKETGETFTITSQLTNQLGRLAAELRSVMFIRGTGSRGTSSSENEPVRKIVFETAQKVDEDQTSRYADASGDTNPIHLDREFARNVAGLPGIILHGMCTMAFASKAILDGVCEGDPSRLKRIKVRFSKPVFPGQTLTTRAWEEGASNERRTYGFETLANGGRVIRDGLAEVTL
jgi:acyl dehydratase